MASSVVSSVKPTPVAEPKALTDRWLELDTLSHTERYRNAYAVGGIRNFDSAQQRSLIVGKIKLDSAGRYTIGFRASSGRYFNWAFGSYTGPTFNSRVTSAASAATSTPSEIIEQGYSYFADPAGLALLNAISSNGWEFYMRELYISATPVKAVTVEFGSLGIERGYSSEITTFDEDGYVSGERVRVHDSKHLFFDEIGFTNAYFGDLPKVNLFDRGSSLKEFNYRQVFANKKAGKYVAFSGEYTRQTGTDTLREAVQVKTPGARLIDGVRFEAYERLNSLTFAGVATSPIGPVPSKTEDGASGFAVTLDKKMGRLKGDVGFATVDSRYSVYANSRFFSAVGFTLNGDTYGLGNRPFVHASYKLAPGVTAFGFYTHEVGSTRVSTLNQQGLNAGMTFDLKELANKGKRVF